MPTMSPPCARLPLKGLQDDVHELSGGLMYELSGGLMYERSGGLMYELSGGLMYTRTLIFTKMEHTANEVHVPDSLNHPFKLTALIIIIWQP